MRKILLAAALWAVSLTAEAQMPRQTFMSYNVRNGTGMDNVTDYSRAGNVIRRQKPDVVAIQEVDSATSRSGGKYVLKEIAEAAGMTPLFAPTIDYQGGKYGIGILTRKQPKSVARFALPGREEARALLVAEFDDYVFASTHLSLTEEDRDSSVAIITDIAATFDKPFFIGGDFNAGPDSRCVAALLENFTPITSTTDPTFPADEPIYVIDYIFVYNSTSRPVKATKAEVLDEPAASDHRPITVKTRY